MMRPFSSFCFNQLLLFLKATVWHVVLHFNFGIKNEITREAEGSLFHGGTSVRQKERPLAYVPWRTEAF